MDKFELPKNYINFLKKFKTNSIFLKIVPSLLSKSITYKAGDYFHINYRFKFKDFFPNPFKILSLLFSFFRLTGFYLKSKFQRKEIACLLTRSGGITKKDSYEDKRFLGLERNLKKKNFNVVYFYHGKIKNKKLFNKNPIIYSEDLFSFSKLIFLITFPLTLIFPILSLKNYPIWKFDLYLCLYSSIIMALFSKYFNKVFFWDFNYYHYPLFLGGHIAKCHLIGSMHNFHPFETVPWTSDYLLQDLNIKYLYTDYLSTNLLITNNDEVKKICRNSHSIKIFNDTISIVIIQENQTNQIELFEYLTKYKYLIKKIYIKLRPDRAGSDLFISNINLFNLNYEIIENIYNVKLNDYIFIGCASTVLLEIAATGRLALSFTLKNKKIFEEPSRKFFDYLKYNSKYEKIVFNPFYISSETDLRSLFNKKLFIKASNPVINFIIFNKYKIESITNQLLINQYH